MTHSEKNEWLLAMNNEYISFMSQQVCELIKRPPDCGEIEKFRWIFTERGQKKKAKLIIEGGSFVMKQSSFRTMLSAVSQRGYILKNFVVDDQVIRENDLLAELPEGFEIEDIVFNLQCTLYNHEIGQGIRQLLERLGLEKTDLDECLYYDDRFILGFHAYGFILAARKEERINNLISNYFADYKLDSEDPPFTILGVYLERYESGYQISQSDHILDLCHWYKIDDDDDADEKILLNRTSDYLSQSELCDKNLYMSFLQNLFFVAISTRPDIALSVFILQQFTIRPTFKQLNGMKQVLSFLRRTYNHHLIYFKQPRILLRINAYSCSEWKGCVDGKSITGYFIHLGNIIISWKSKKQSTAVNSFYKAQIAAARSCMGKAICFKQMFMELLPESSDCGLNMFLPEKAYYV